MIDNQFEQIALSHGKEGAAWLKSIPNLISEHEQLWSIEVSSPFPLSYNYVAPAKRADGSRVVLKIGYPGDREFKSEVEALKIFNGVGAAKLLEEDPEKCVILLERIMPGNPLSIIEDDDEATEVVVSVIQELHKPLPRDHKLITIEDWASSISKYLKDWYPDNDGPLPRQLVTKAGRLFDQLIETSAPAMLVHGDLHHDNILKSDKHGWVAIDPKGIAAEPLYDVAAMIRNPYEKLKGIKDLSPLLRRRIMVLSKKLGADPQRILNWGFAQSMLSAVWNVGEVKGAEFPLRVAETLDKLHL